MFRKSDNANFEIIQKVSDFLESLTKNEELNFNMQTNCTWFNFFVALIVLHKYKIDFNWKATQIHLAETIIIFCQYSC